MTAGLHPHPITDAEEGKVWPDGGLPALVDVLVVGLGPVGATLANILGRHGVRTLVIDRADDILPMPRAIALDNEALRILQLAGLAETDFDRVAIPQVRLHSPRFGEFARMDTLGAIDGHPKLVTFYQPDLERALRARLAALPAVAVATGVDLTGLRNEADVVTADLVRDGAGCQVRARWVVGADGASSTVRRLAGLDFVGRSYGQDWLVVDASNVVRPIDHVEFLCDHRRPVPHMTAPGGRERWEFMLRPGETREQMEDEGRVRALLAPWGGTDGLTIERRAVYRFHARSAAAYRKGRLFLAGDAAHVTPPFAGQGLVSGLRDAANLGWKLAWVTSGRAAPAILDSYDRERRPHARAMIDFARVMGRLVMPRSAAAATLVHGGMCLIRLVGPLRRHFERMDGKPSPRFRRGLFMPARGRAGRLRGRLLPQGLVATAEAGTVASDEILGRDLCLIGLGVDPAATLDPALAVAFRQAGGRIVRIMPRGCRAGSAGAAQVEDLTGVFLPGLGGRGRVIMVRPDRTILHDGPAVEADRLVRETLSLLGAASQTGMTATSVAASF